jgi:hypothetical protein
VKTQDITLSARVDDATEATPVRDIGTKLPRRTDRAHSPEPFLAPVGADFAD